MKTAAALLVAASFTVASVVSAQAQNRDTARGPSVDTAKSRADMIMGQITKIDPQQKTISVKAERIPGHPGQNLTMEYQAKDSSELAKYKVGEWVTGKLSKQGENPPRLESIKMSNRKGGMRPGGMRDSGRTGGIGNDTTRTEHRGRMGRDSTSGMMSRDTSRMGAGARHDSATRKY